MVTRARLLVQKDPKITHGNENEYHFNEEDCLVQATVFSERRQQHAPLCPINGRPMQRAGLRDVELLLTEAEASPIAGLSY